jgi:3-hexulose-6-phosphate synthase
MLPIAPDSSLGAMVLITATIPPAQKLDRGSALTEQYAGELEADIALAPGADYVTVLGIAGDSTIVGAIKAAKARGKGIVVDLIGVADKVTRAQQVTSLETIAAVQSAGAHVAVAGGAIYGAADPAASAAALRAAIV